MTEPDRSNPAVATFVSTGRLLLGASAVLWFLTVGWSATTRAASSQHSDVLQNADTADVAALRAVCSQCHDLSMFSGTIQSHDEWINTIQKMVDLGARGTDDQFNDILRYLIENQTSININTAPMEDVASVLGASDTVAQAVVARREVKPFAGIADLLSVCGLDATTVLSRQKRIGF